MIATAAPTRQQARVSMAKKRESTEYATRTIRIDKDVFEMLELAAPLLGKRSVREFASEILSEALTAKMAEIQEMLKNKTAQFKKNRPN